LIALGQGKGVPSMEKEAGSVASLTGELLEKDKALKKRALALNSHRISFLMPLSGHLEKGEFGLIYFSSKRL